MSTTVQAPRASDVTLAIPGSLRYQLVYRQERRAPFPPRHATGAEFHFFDHPWETLGATTSIASRFGWMGYAKTWLKLCTPTRMFYVLANDGVLAHHGWVTASRCKHYYVEPESAVVGPIWSNPVFRGAGLGTLALQLAMNVLIAKGIHVFYIDTSDDNLPCQRLIEKCGFGRPVAAYLRPAERATR